MATEDNVFQSLENAWRAMCEHYDNCPNDVVRAALNIVGKICTKVETDLKNAEENKEERLMRRHRY